VAELKKKVVRGFAWNVAEKIASALFQTWVTINVLNRIMPDDAAMVAILAAFVVVFNVFVDSGFSQALIRKKDPSHTDFSSAFWFNIAIAVVVYVVLIGLSYPAAYLLDMPDLVRFAPVFFLIVPVGALGIIQQTVLTRAYDFRKLSTIFFASTLGSGAVAAALAFAGAGVWALVAQRISQTAIRSILLWALGRWRPQAGFSGASIRSMFGFSSRLLATDLLNNLFTSIPSFIIGRIHGGTLGVYDTARKVRDLPVNQTMAAMQSVTFPALAEIRDDEEKFTRAVGRVVGSIAFLMFPIMAGLITVADEMFGFFLKAQWQPSVPFFRILCLAGFFTPLAVISSNILRTRSDGRDVLRAEIVKKILATVVFAVTIPQGVVAIAWGVVAIAFTDAAVSFTVARRQSSYGFRALARDVLPVFGLVLVMAAAVILVGAVAVRPIIWAGSFVSAKFTIGLLLGMKIVTGITVYTLGAAILRLPALHEFIEVLGKVVGKIKA
jgi:O-antigen/teichoic acid export membrane protein